MMGGRGVEEGPHGWREGLGGDIVIVPNGESWGIGRCD